MGTYDSDDSRSPSPPPNARPRDNAPAVSADPRRHSPDMRRPASPPPQTAVPRSSPPRDPRRRMEEHSRANGRSPSRSPYGRPLTRSRSGSPFDQQNKRIVRRSRSPVQQSRPRSPVHPPPQSPPRRPSSPGDSPPPSRQRRMSSGSRSPEDRSRRYRSRSRSSSQGRRRHGSPDFEDRGNEEDGYRVHVADLDTEARKSDLERTFGKFGPLKEIWMARSIPCFAFVVFRYLEDSKEAIRQTDGIELVGRRIRVTPARPRTRGMGRRGFDPNMRCYQCGDRGHFSRDCPDSKWGYKRPPSPRRGYNNRGHGGGSYEDRGGYRRY